MKVIKTIDLWTEQKVNHYECFNGCFVDGFENNSVPFDEYKIVKNCNCIISYDNKDINISNKHHAIVFYKDKEPVRLAVINSSTDVDKCVNIALNQYFGTSTLGKLFETNNIASKTINLKQKPILNSADPNKETDVGSCDRWSLLYSMLKGSYTESESKYGNFESGKYEFIPNISIKYSLKTDSEVFEIDHYCAFINDVKTRLIPVQSNSSLSRC